MHRASGSHGERNAHRTYGVGFRATVRRLGDEHAPQGGHGGAEHGDPAGLRAQSGTSRLDDSTPKHVLRVRARDSPHVLISDS